MKKQLLERMIRIATDAHHNQFDKGGFPYIFHPINVMYNLQTDDEELMCIAIGHDLLEDTHITIEQLYYAGMTSRIVKGIEALTKKSGQTYDEYKESVFSNPDAILVEMADLQHNTDIHRLKGVTDKDIIRTEKYYKFYMELREKSNV